MHRIFDLQGDTYNNGQTKKQILLSERNQEWYADLSRLSRGFFYTGHHCPKCRYDGLASHASAGQYAGFTVIAAGGTYFEMVLMELVANARYLLMSCSLSQKFSSETGLLHRLLVGFDVTDEIFGVAVSEPGKLNPFYNYGMMTVAIPGWSLGTFFGVIMGNILPANIVSALSVGLYGMFLAIIIPPARKNKVIAALVTISMVSSYIFSRLPVISDISSGIRTIILTVAIAGIAAILFPVKEETEHAA